MVDLAARWFLRISRTTWQADRICAVAHPHSYVWPIHMCDAFICVTNSYLWLIHICDSIVCVTHSYVWPIHMCDSFIFIYLTESSIYINKHVYVIWHILIHSHSYICHDSSHSYMWHGSFSSIYVTWFILIHIYRSRHRPCLTKSQNTTYFKFLFLETQLCSNCTQWNDSLRRQN